MTDPGQSTPWARLPIPSEGKQPDIPVDLAALADPLDSLLRNVIGGSSAPTAPITPSLIDASASIGSLNSTQSTQQQQITTMQGQIAALNIAPWATHTARSTSYTLSGGQMNSLAHSLQVPSSTTRTLLLCGVAVTMRWTDAATTAVLMGSLQIKQDGETVYSDRARSLQAGVYQTLSAWHIETLPAGIGCRVGLALSSVGAANGKTAEAAYMWPHIYAIKLPWASGPDVPIVGAPN
ncbi:hypothetical protein [Streptomyces malaysiensis]|uniref:Uncharacterized protein n=1 Tax=Streptomyces malaysiensis TaxID=92644 RepID=A0A7X5X7M5_STRMQ|nr:hypothetical protein [Streptomyces malaysiensis]NIY68057.1 hypothetical protein [Streptomyces malaysiensis]